MTRYFVLACCLSLCCTSAKDSKNGEQSGQDTVSFRNPPPPTTIKDNLSLVGAVILSIDIVDNLSYKLHIHLRTSIPEGGQASLAEPDQKLTVVPLYRRTGDGEIEADDPRNRRLLQVRTKKGGDFLLGKISLGQNGTWYLIDTETP